MFIARPDAQLYAIPFGAGPKTLVAMGGWVGSWEVWAETLSLLSPTWQTVGFDHRGAGATLAAAESISLPTLIDDLFAVLDALDLKQCVLAAESAGVAVALHAALQQPQRFEGLVLVDGLYHREQPSSDPFVQALQANYPATLDYFVDACVPEPNSEAIRSWGRQIVSRSNQAAAIQLYQCFDGLDLRPQAPQITLPSLIIHGDADQIVPLSDSEWLATHLPNNKLVVLPGAGHVPTITRPHEVADAIQQFFVP